MKVVLFCGGLGMRLREYSETIPKPMAEIGYRPILWHVMRYYAHYGYKDFILCLGYKGDVIKRYFLDYDECISNDFILTNGGRNCELVSSDISDWSITFADTGISSNIGQRLMAIERYLGEDEVFLANYTDALTDLRLDDYVQHFLNSKKTASLLAVKPTQSFHVISAETNGTVSGIKRLDQSGTWINGGYFVFRRNIFDYLEQGEELVEQPFARLIDRGELISYRFDDFWMAMDTFKDKLVLDEMYARREVPWEVWKGLK
ncbi:sugar phosphate nucleotidyltransferase [Gemmatimonadota bacterium]